jgi:hypothetical protein
MLTETFCIDACGAETGASSDGGIAFQLRNSLRGAHLRVDATGAEHVVAVTMMLESASQRGDAPKSAWLTSSFV